MRKGVVFRIYPNKEQQKLINQTLGCCRYIYNYGLSMRNEAYKNGDKIGYSQTSARLSELKRMEEYSFLGEVDSIALQQALRDLDVAFSKFFHKLSAHPKYKSKKNRFQSYRTLNSSDKRKIRLEGKYITLPKLGRVKFKQSMEVGTIHNVTIERRPTGKYFAVLNVDFEPRHVERKRGAIGIDVGIKEFYSDSNGDIVPNPRHLERSARKLAREQRRLSRKQKGSNNRSRQRKKVALVHEKVTSQRNDFLQKQSTILVRENQTICVEDLHIKGMLRTHKLAKAISSVSWAKFFEMLEYKAEWYGSEIIKVPTMYPSSQLCSCCGYKNSLVKALSVRVWVCPSCLTKHNRDTNASINILNKGLQMKSV